MIRPTTTFLVGTFWARRFLRNIAHRTSVMAVLALILEVRSGDRG